ncbi:MAG: prepilin-type N-terminal cleavage/methylation domain-containing protein [Bacillota bacterium]|jgi:type II secretory pathway pseudopilin PulG
MIKLSRQRRQAGITALEMLIAVALIALLTLALYGAASAMRRSYRHNTLSNYNLLAVKQGLSRIASELRYAESVDLTEAGVAKITVDGSTTTVKLEGTSLKITDSAGQVTTISEPLAQSLNFTNTGARVTVTLKVRDPSRATNPALEMATTVRMLNVSE